VAPEQTYAGRQIPDSFDHRIGAEQRCAPAASEASNTADREIVRLQQSALRATVGVWMSYAFGGDGWSSFGRPASLMFSAQSVGEPRERVIDAAGNLRADRDRNDGSGF